MDKQFCDKKDTATAIDTYEGLKRITTMLASTLADLIWIYASPETTFIVSGTGVVIAVVYFMWMPYRRTYILEKSKNVFLFQPNPSLEILYPGFDLSTLIPLMFEGLFLQPNCKLFLL